MKTVINIVSWISLLALCHQAAQAANQPITKCDRLMYSKKFGAGIPPSFTGVVAHGTHSLTIPDINYYFPNNKDEIFMPVVNPDLIADDLLLFQPPNFETPFETPALRAADKILNHMNIPHRDLERYNDMEKIVHVAHMQDIWANAADHYKRLLTDPNGPDTELCKCIRDVKDNGVVKMLEMVGHKLRQARIKSNYLSVIDVDDDVKEKVMKLETDEQTQNVEAMNDFGGSLYHFLTAGEDNDTKKKATKIAAVATSRAAMNEWELPKLDSVENWTVWKNSMMAGKPHREEYGRMMALYLHCLLS